MVAAAAPAAMAANVKWYWLALAAAVAIALSRREVRDVASTAGESVATAALDVYYATTQATRENEEKFAPIIAQVEEQNGIPEGLLHRLIYQESRFRSDIISGEYVSSAGALGIAQIVPRWHPGVDPLDPEGAIRYAGRYLADNYRRFGSWRQALAAYNWGQGNQARDLQDGIVGNEWPPETARYVEEITRDVEVA